MDPTGLFGIPWIVVVLPVALWAAWEVSWPLARRSGATRRGWIGLHALLVVPIVMGSKALSLFEHAQPPSLSLQELVRGWRYPGALLAVVLVVPLVRRQFVPSVRLGAVADCLAVGYCFALAIYRLSCFMNGCCTGPVCEHAFCMSYPAGSQALEIQVAAGTASVRALESLPVLPLHGLFALADAFAGLLCLAWVRMGGFQGGAFLLFLVLHEGLILALERLRWPEVPLLQAAAALALVLGALPLAVQVVRKTRSASLR